jgi:hypothetical protein
MPRTTDGEMDIEEAHGRFTLQVPVEGGGRLELNMSREELFELYDVAHTTINGLETV